MRDFVITLAAAIAGAALAIVIVFVLAQNGKLPINDRQMQTYLMLHPELAPAMMGRAQQLEDAKSQAAQADTIRKIGQTAFFDPAVAFVTGPADAKATLVEFYDYDCPYCKISLPAVKKFYEAHKNDTRFSFIEFPIQQLHGPSAVLAARASLAARKQPEHYMDFHFLLLGEDGAITDQMIADDAAKAGPGCGQAEGRHERSGHRQGTGVFHRPGPQGRGGWHAHLHLQRQDPSRRGG